MSARVGARARRVFLLMVCLVVMVAGSVSASGRIETPPLPRAIGGNDCPPSVLDEASAAPIAAACGRDVEVLAERTEWSTLYAQPDGSKRLEMSAAAQRTRVNGGWEPIDTTLVATGDGIEVAAPAVAMRFSDGSHGQPLVRMERDGHELTFDVPFDLPAPLMYGSALEYHDVVPGVDLIVNVNEDGTGISEVLRVDSPEAAADPRLAELVFPVEVSDGLALAEVEGGFTAADAAGEVVFAAPPPTMWDSGADADLPATTPALRPGSLTLGAGRSAAAAANGAARLHGPVGRDQVAIMSLRMAEGAVRITPAREMIADPGTVWPVYVDPPISAQRVEWTTISSAGWKHYMFAGDDGLGYCSSTASGCSTPLFRSRIMWEFGGLTVFKDLERGHVLSAVFSAFGTHSYSCTAYPVTAHRVGGFTSATGWPGTWWGSALDTETVAHKSACGNERWIEWDVTEALRQIADEDGHAVAIGLRDPNETTMAGWKRYRYDAKLSVTYNRLPNAPAAMHFTSPNVGCGTEAAPTYLRSRTATVSAYFSDPDEDNVQPNLAIFNTGAPSTPGAVLWATRYAPVVNGTHTVPVPIPTSMVEGRQYRFQMNAVDPYVVGGAASACEFVLDLTTPGPPSIATVPGQPAEYTTDGPTGGLLVPGAFTFASASADVDRYQYRINGGQLVGTVPHETATGRSEVLSFTPTSVGPQRIEVEAVDRAGNVSSTTTHRFYVAFPGLLGQWFLDEDAPASTAPDMVTPGHPLTLSPGAEWAPGLLAAFDIDDGDRALLIGPNDAAFTSDAPIVATNESFSVMAFVRLDDTSSAATAVSQDGELASGFELGYRTDGCPGGAPGCWAFAMNSVDAAGTPAATVVTSEVPVVAGDWVQLTGLHDATNGQVSMYVCALGRPSSPVVNPFPVRSAPAGHVVTWNQAGPFVLGRGRASGVGVRPWKGMISAVTAYDTALIPPVGDTDNTEVLTSCQAGMSAPLIEE